jgi:hypothetical protein
MFGYITLFTGFALSVVAAVFAIFGIVALFAGLPIYAAVMGTVIELGKVVGVVWIYRNWGEKTKLKFVMLPFVLMMMALTSGGIFGFLSKAHLEQTAPVTNNSAKIERLDQRITRERADIDDAEARIAQLDETLQVLIDASIISDPVRGARVVREKQKPERDILKLEIDESMDAIDEYEDQKLVFNQELNELELEVGPVKYIAALIYEEPQDSLDEAVRIVIIAFIFVFDPMAVLLLMAGNYTLMGRIGAAPGRKEDEGTPPSEGKKIVANADAEFVPAEVIAEVMADVINEAKITPDKAKAEDIPAEPTDDSHHISTKENDDKYDQV